MAVGKLKARSVERAFGLFGFVDEEGVEVRRVSVNGEVDCDGVVIS